MWEALIKGETRLSTKDTSTLSENYVYKH